MKRLILTLAMALAAVAFTGRAETNAAAPAAATIADRFKLDAPDPNAKKAASGAGATVAAIAGLAALAVVGVLTFTLFQHWEFLKGA